jgi:hypothetical protein
MSIENGQQPATLEELARKMAEQFQLLPRSQRRAMLRKRAKQRAPKVKFRATRRPTDYYETQFNKGGRSDRQG